MGKKLKKEEALVRCEAFNKAIHKNVFPLLEDAVNSSAKVLHEKSMRMFEAFIHEVNKEIANGMRIEKKGIRIMWKKVLVNQIRKHLLFQLKIISSFPLAIELQSNGEEK